MVASAVQIQSDYAKTSFEGVDVQATKMGELYSNLARVTFKPCGVAIATTYTKSPKV